MIFTYRFMYLNSHGVASFFPCSPSSALQIQQVWKNPFCALSETCNALCVYGYAHLWLKSTKVEEDKMSLFVERWVGTSERLLAKLGCFEMILRSRLYNMYVPPSDTFLVHLYSPPIKERYFSSIFFFFTICNIYFYFYFILKGTAQGTKNACKGRKQNQDSTSFQSMRSSKLLDAVCFVSFFMHIIT